jgi:hypothetical protein
VNWDLQDSREMQVLSGHEVYQGHEVIKVKQAQWDSLEMQEKMGDLVLLVCLATKVKRKCNNLRYTELSIIFSTSLFYYWAM